MSLNIATLQIEEPDFLENLVRVIEKHQIPTQCIKLEILESSLVNSEAARAWVLECRKLGFQLALDDFGTGYSNLGYLNRYRFDTIKIDQSFVCDLQENTNSQNICRAIISLAQALDMTLVAEGIEEREQQETLTDMGCTYGQGYAFSKPLNLPEAIALCQESQVLFV